MEAKVIHAEWKGDTLIIITYYPKPDLIPLDVDAPTQSQEDEDEH